MSDGKRDAVEARTHAVRTLASMLARHGPRPNTSDKRPVLAKRRQRDSGPDSEE